jgi:hypothetical protein
MLYEHLHRYYFAQRYCHGRRVLDLACGEGYGSAILADVADEVVALDVDPATIEHARARYAGENLRFVASSMLSPGAVAPATFDVVVCFEAIEHVEAHEAVLDAIASALTPTGLALVSTPDRAIYSEAAGYHNPFHVRELDRTEFTALLSERFAHVDVLDQQAVVGSRIHRRDGDRSVVYVAREGDGWVARGPAAVPYLVAVASNVAPPVPSSSTMLDVDLGALRVAAAQLADVAAERDRLAEELDRSAAEGAAATELAGSLRAVVEALTHQLEGEREAARAASELRAMRSALEAQLARQSAAVEGLRTELAALRGSSAWRVVDAVSRVRARLRGLVHARLADSRHRRWSP